MTQPGRRATLRIATGLVLAAPGLARAQAWPARPLRLIVPFPPGGSNDVLARLLRPYLQQQLGQPVQVENRAGRYGAAGALELMRAAPDGHTWLLSFDSEATNQTLLADLPYKAMEDLWPAGRIATGALVVASGSAQPYDDIAGMAEAARRGPLEFATAGTGGIPHIAMLAVAEALGIRLTQATYRGGVAALGDVVAGFVPMIASNLPVLGPPIRAGTLKPLAVTTAARSTRLPQVKTLAEQGVPGFEAGTWWMMMGRRSAPEAARDGMARALATVLADAEPRRLIEEHGVEVAPLEPPAAAAFLGEEIARWGALVRRYGITG